MEKAPWETEELAPWQTTENDSVNVGDIAKKFAQGAGFGMLPRLAGALEVGGQAVGLKGLGGTDVTDIEFQKPDILDPSKLGEDYESAKKAYEQALDVASQRSPVTSGVAEFAGGVMAPLPGGLPKTLTGKALKSAGIGAIGGYGYSRDDEEKLARMGIGAGLGGLAPVVAEKAIAPAIKGAGKAVGKFKKLLVDWGEQFKTMPKENEAEIIAASKALGFEPSKAMISNSKQIAALEEGLAKGGGLAATPFIKQQQAIQEGIKKGTEKVGSAASQRSNIQIGEDLSKNLSEEASQIFAPAKELYQSVQKDLQKIPVNKDVITKAFAAAKRNDLFRTNEGRSFIEKIQSEVGVQSDIPSLMRYTRNFWKIKSPHGTGREDDYIDALYGTLKSIRDNSINSIKADEFVKRAGKTGAQSVDEVIDNLTQADKLFESGMNEINSISGILGQTGSKFVSPKQFKTKVSEKQFEQLSNQAGGTSFETLANLKQNFSQTFEKARESMVNKILAQSETKGEIDLGKLIRQTRKISPEARNLIFDEETNALIGNLENVYNSLPAPVNPSNTSGMQRMWQSFTSPTKSIADAIAAKALNEAGPGGSAFARGAARGAQKIERALRPGGGIYEAPRQTLEAIPRIIQPKIHMDKKQPDQTSIIDKVKGTKYEALLNNALKNGGDRSFAAANYVLKNRDADYRKLFEDLS